MKTISFLLKATGIFLLLAALFFAGISLLSLIERLQHGRGIMFADVEFFGLMALIFAAPGALMFLTAKKLSKKVKSEELPGGQP